MTEGQKKCTKVIGMDYVIDGWGINDISGA
jgi:hypothetical protein